MRHLWKGLLVIACCMMSSLCVAEITTPSAPPPINSFKVAAVEFNPTFMQFETNLPKLAAAAETAAKGGAKLIVLPEMATSGYIYKDRQQINPYLDTIPGKTTAILEPIAKKYHIYIAVGIGEVDPVSNLAYNSAALIGPNGYIGKYRKNGLNSSDALWATRGNLGYPVFDTELGKIALIICYDDAYLQSLIIPSLRGANIIAYLTSSDRLLLTEPGAQFNHSTIANIASVAGWIGTYIVASNRTDTETNPVTNVVTHYDGGASIWDPNGKNLAQAPVSTPEHPAQPAILYAMIDPQLYDNAAKQTLIMRRPELYPVLNLYRAPIDPEASTESHEVKALLLQYTPINNDKNKNIQHVTQMITDASKTGKFNLIVLPQNSLTGMLDSIDMKANAETLQDNTVKLFAILAKLYQTHIIFSMPEKNGDQYYDTAVLLNDKGTIAGVYRKSHLNTGDKLWATAGEDLPVFDTAIGRIAIMLGDEVRIPDLAAVYAVKRADMIAIPSSWSGQYAGPVLVDPGLLIKPFPENTMYMWYNIAKYAQAYTLVANYVGGNEAYKGSSGVYSLDPIQGHYVPEVTSANAETVLHVTFNTIGSPDWWMTQAYMAVGRRAELSTPMTLKTNSDCFVKWQKDSTGNDFCWDH